MGLLFRSPNHEHLVPVDVPSSGYYRRLFSKRAGHLDGTFAAIWRVRTASPPFDQHAGVRCIAMAPILTLNVLFA